MGKKYGSKYRSHFASTAVVSNPVGLSSPVLMMDPERPFAVGYTGQDSELGEVDYRPHSVIGDVSYRPGLVIGNMDDPVLSELGHDEGGPRYYEGDKLVRKGRLIRVAKQQIKEGHHALKKAERYDRQGDRVARSILKDIADDEGGPEFTEIHGVTIGNVYR